MKKFIAVFLAMLMIFSVTSVAFATETPEGAGDTVAEEPAAPEEEGTTAASGEPTTRNIVNKDGLVVPINFTQLKSSFVFKIVEKIINLILGIFGKSLDDFLTEGVSDAGDWIDEAISNIDAGLGD